MELGVLLFAKVNGTSVSYNVSLKVGRSPHTSIPLLRLGRGTEDKLETSQNRHA